MIPLIWLTIAFALSEIILAIVKHSQSGTTKNRNDRGSMILLWIMITSGITGGFFLAKPVIPFWSGFGFVFIISGLIIRWIAIVQLGKSFTVDVSVSKKSCLKTDGFYTRIRHPSYSGLLSVIVGFAATMSSFYSFLILVIPSLLAVIYRIRVEEELMAAEFGDSYIEYKSVSKKLIPGIY